MKVVARRVVDGAMLALVKMFLEAPIVDERDGGQPRRNRQGTPQGGVLSPLLANIYLDLLDRNFRRHVANGEMHGRLIRYADDLVVLTPEEPGREMGWIRALVERLGLSLSASKTRVLDARQERFDFLGHRHRWQGGRLYLDLSPKSKRRIHDELREKTRHTWKRFDELISELNGYIRGARQYYRPWPAWSLMRGDALWRQHGLERWNLPLALRPEDSRRAR